MTHPTVDEFLISVRKNPAILDSFPQVVADMWRERAGIKVEVVKTSTKISSTDMAISLQIDTDSTLEQAFDFALNLQAMLDAKIISEEVWTLGVESLEFWMTINQLGWDSFLAQMEGAM